MEWHLIEPLGFPTIMGWHCHKNSMIQKQEMLDSASSGNVSCAINCIMCGNAQYSVKFFCFYGIGEMI